MRPTNRLLGSLFDGPKIGEIPPPDSPSQERAVDWTWCLSTWHKLGRPVVYLGSGDAIYDLSFYMYPEKLAPSRLRGIAAWLKELMPSPGGQK